MVVIKHISIKDANTGERTKENGFTAAYEIMVALSNNPDSSWKRFFLREWRKEFLRKNETIRLTDNEMKLSLKKGDDIQSFIECIKNAISRTNRRIAESICSREKVQKKNYKFIDIRTIKRFKFESDGQNDMRHALYI